MVRMREPTIFCFSQPGGLIAITSREQYRDGINKYDLVAIRESTKEQKVIHSTKTGWFDKKPRGFDDLFVSRHFEVPFAVSDAVVERLMELSKTDPVKAHERIAYITKQHEKREKEKAAQAAQATSATDKPATEPAPTPQQPKEGNK